jgi:putative oxidoreductase
MVKDIALLLARAVVGGGIAAHGAQKAFGAFEGPGPDGAAKYMESVGLKPGELYGPAAAWTEMTAGALIMLGLGGSLGPSMLMSTMTVANVTVHAKNGFFAAKNGIEFPTLYLSAALAFAGGGYGRLSLDERIGLQRYRTHLITGLVLAGGIGAAIAILSQRESSEPKPAPAKMQNNGVHTPHAEPVKT